MQQLSLEDQPLLAWGSKDSGPGGSGAYLFGIGGSGTAPGQFARPHGMAVDSKGDLYVADAGNQRIQRFAIPNP